MPRPPCERSKDRSACVTVFQLQAFYRLTKHLVATVSEQLLGLFSPLLVDQHGKSIDRILDRVS